MVTVVLRKGVQLSQQSNQSVQPNPTQPNPTTICGFMNFCGWIWLKFLKKILIVRVVDSTIGKLIEPNLTDYYHIIFTQKEGYTYLHCIYIKVL